MEGLEKLLKLDNGEKDIIINEYGNIQNFYQTVFNLNLEEYNLHNSHNPRLNAIRTELLQIEMRLEELGINNAHDLITDISADFTEIIVNRRIAELNEYLTSLGTDFDEMRKWINEKYNI